MHTTGHLRAHHHLGHILEDALDLQDLVKVGLHPVAPVHHLVAVAGDLEALARLVKADDGDVRQPHLRLAETARPTRDKGEARQPRDAQTCSVEGGVFQTCSTV